MQKKQLFTTSDLVKVALLSALAVLLQLFDFPIGIFPSFYELDFSDVPAMIGAVIIGPYAGVFIELIKNLIHMLRTSSAFVGEFANFMIGAAIVIPLGIYCRKDKSTKGFIIGSVSGVIFMAIVGAILNAYVLLPLYAKMFNCDIMDFVAMSTVIFPFIDTYTKFIFLTVIPFNLFKGAIVTLVATFLFKYISRNTFMSK